jgi:hypothetical protein
MAERRDMGDFMRLFNSIRQRLHGKLRCCSEPSGDLPERSDWPERELSQLAAHRQGRVHRKFVNASSYSRAAD